MKFTKLLIGVMALALIVSFSGFASAKEKAAEETVKEAVETVIPAAEEAAGEEAAEEAAGEEAAEEAAGEEAAEEAPAEGGEAKGDTAN